MKTKPSWHFLFFRKSPRNTGKSYSYYHFSSITSDWEWKNPQSGAMKEHKVGRSKMPAKGMYSTSTGRKEGFSECTNKVTDNGQVLSYIGTPRSVAVKSRIIGLCAVLCRWSCLLWHGLVFFFCFFFMSLRGLSSFFFAAIFAPPR